MKTHRFALAAFAAAPCFAQHLPESPETLEPMVVTATRSEQRGNRLPAAVSVITRQEIAASGARHLVEVLRLAGGAHVTDLYGNGSRATVDLRGFGDGAHSTTLLLVDGRRLNNADIAAPDLGTVSLRDIERIEIINGSAGVLYGDQAVGGVINIITRVPATSAWSAQAGGGSDDGVHGALTAAHRAGAWSYRLAAESRGSDNYRDRNRLEYKSALARIGYDAADARLFVESGWIDEALQTPGALFANEVAQGRRQSSASFAGDFADSRTAFARLNGRQQLAADWSLEADLTFRESDGAFRLGSAAFGPAMADSAQDRFVRSFNPRLAGAYPTAWGAALLTAGADAQLAHYELTSAFGVQSNRQRQLDLYAQTITPLPGSLELTAGVRSAIVRNEVQDGFTFLAPTRFHDSRRAGELGLAFRPAAALRLFARYDRNFRFAKVDEFTNAGAPPGSGIANVGTQAGDSYEAGAEWQGRAGALRVLGYRLRLAEEITFDPATFTNINLDRTRRKGVLLEADWRAAPALDLGARYHCVDAAVTRGAFAGRDIPLVAAQTGKLFARVELPAGFSAGIEALATAERAFSGDFDNTLGRLPGHAVVNVNAGRQWRGWDVRGRVNNILGKEYSEYGAAGFDPGFNEVETFFPSPELNVWLSARHDW